MLLALKLFLVPASICLVTLAGQRWGPAVAGWLGGMPVIAGPILLLLAIEHGIPFAAEAAIAAVSSLLPFLVFVVLYARLAGRCHWLPCYGVAIAGWGLAAWGIALLAPDVWWAILLAVMALCVAPRLIPVLAGSAAHRIGGAELVLRMAAGLTLTLLITSAAGALGTGWSGILTVFPVLASVLAVFSHRSQGAAFVVPLLHGTTRGLLALFAFCATLALVIDRGLAIGFLLALATSLLVQLASRGLIRKTQP
ncbi:MAG TPA: hypothetical protein PLW86_03325 [Rhodocyclaceae bacterium]|nr:hypothetical protein [Rhodocyclaceae bacterium]